MIERDPAGAAREAFDLVVIGGGIFGVALLLEAARRGLRAALVERGDFGGETSWNTLRVVHGGLRYLQSADLRRFRESVGERSRFLREFPDLVFPAGFLLPLDGRGLRRPAVFRAALGLNDLLSRGRNRGLRADRCLGPGRVLSPAEARQLAPLLPRSGLRGAALWHDGFMPDSQRLLIEMLHWAAACGAVALNYCEAREPLVRDGAIGGVRVRDAVGRVDLELRAPRVVNCSGPWCDQTARRMDGAAPGVFRPALGFNVLLDRDPPADLALGVPAEGGGTYFLVPWKGLTLAGTHHAPDDAEGVSPAMVERFLEALGRGLPGFAAARQQVLRVHWGRLPAVAAGSAAPTSRDTIVDHGAAGGPAGLVSVSGVKFTTARAVAERALALLLAREGRPLPAPGAVDRPPPAAPPPAERVEVLFAREPGAARAELRARVASEAVVRLDDLLLRRTDWGADPRRGRRIGAEVRRLLAWEKDPV